MRENTYFTDTLSREGKGALVKGDIGLTWSGFRPSDDACTYGYLIPSNMFAVIVLGYLEEIEKIVYHSEQMQTEAACLRQQIEEGIGRYGIVETEDYGKIYAYEVDGFGQYNLMDDANIPSLLSLPYLGYRGDAEVIRNTRRLYFESRLTPITIGENFLWDWQSPHAGQACLAVGSYYAGNDFGG